MWANSVTPLPKSPQLKHKNYETAKFIVVSVSSSMQELRYWDKLLWTNTGHVEEGVCHAEVWH